MRQGAGSGRRARGREPRRFAASGGPERTVVTLKLHSDTWANERPVVPFLQNVPAEQIGPDGARLGFEFQFVKPGKGVAFVRIEWNLELETKVRSLEVARWVLDRLSEVTEIDALEHDGKKLDEIGLALVIEDATKLLDRGPRSDPPDADRDTDSKPPR